MMVILKILITSCHSSFLFTKAIVWNTSRCHSSLTQSNSICCYSSDCAYIIEFCRPQLYLYSMVICSFEIGRFAYQRLSVFNNYSLAYKQAFPARHTGFIDFCVKTFDSGAPYSNTYRKTKETRELIFSWLSWLAVLLVGAYARRRRRRLRSRAKWRHTALICRVLLWYWTSMLWSTDTCQNRVSADQYHVAISGAQVQNSSRSHVFFEVDRWPRAGFLIGSRAHVRLTCWKQSRIALKLD